jgi:hypothetical protein
MKVKYAKINVGFMLLCIDVDLGHDPDYVPDPDCIQDERETWDGFLTGEISFIDGGPGDHDAWTIEAHRKTATVTHRTDYVLLKVDVPLVLVKAEMRRIIEEHDAAAAENGAGEYAFWSVGGTLFKCSWHLKSRICVCTSMKTWTH